MIPLSLASPITLEEKFLYRAVCEARIPWDQKLPQELETLWQTWENSLTDKVELARSIAQHQEQIVSIDLHAFSDASSQGVPAAAYAVTYQPTGVSQERAKSRLTKKGLTIRRLKLVSGHMVANLVDNVKEALQGFPVECVHCWLDSSVALHWIKAGGDYKQFVSN